MALSGEAILTPRLRRQNRSTTGALPTAIAAAPPLTRAVPTTAESAVVAAQAGRWQRDYAWRLLLTDSLIIVGVVFGAQALRFGQSNADLYIPGVTGAGFDVAYTAVSAVFVLAWICGLRLYDTRDAKVVGSGWAEYRRVVDASIRVFGLLAIFAFLLHIDVARAYLLLALPAGVTALVGSRWLWRRWLAAQRDEGRFLSHAVIVGEHAKSLHIAREMQRDSTSGLVITGALTERGPGVELLPGIPVVGSLEDAIAGTELVGVDAVVYSGSDLISPAQLRQFGWDLQSRNVDLIVAAALTDIAGPRIHARPVAGLSLIHVDYPAFTGSRYAAKRAFDVVVSSLALVALSPLFLVLAVMVRRDGGPALFRQRRVGLEGRRFTMLKFRTMVTDAEQRLPDLLAASEGNGVLFKMRSDPRVTSLGQKLRQLSLDELPQLVNVLRGDMSLVGPRPPLMSEVDTYEKWVQRRLLVKPGITGLWQISGRSDLSWDDSIRLDLYYVENRSLTSDVAILWRTLRVVLQRRGAY
ncbi:exopolysaccharide biosynthesis polyprenyl glycosylphosphotransferase [Microbacterium murale]|uniref:Exopolysaccharide biosynthesis polyprenyl glycosylphosphotransferase n=1 Tax=Microbacterium murale TaxID=1081040 RepID=A0ABU0PB84_9MICO|nr:exopolysaccharide biosynthesis polyprenyl glycosylphosphotransferase [Microbacterium murale]